MADVKTTTVAEEKKVELTSKTPVEKYKNLLLILLGVATVGVAGYFYYKYTVDE